MCGAGAVDCFLIRGKWYAKLCIFYFLLISQFLGTQHNCLLGHAHTLNTQHVVGREREGARTEIESMMTNCYAKFC